MRVRVSNSGSGPGLGFQTRVGISTETQKPRLDFQSSRKQILGLQMMGSGSQPAWEFQSRM